MSSGTQTAIVKKELLSEVAVKDKYCVNNKHDGEHKPLPPSKIVQRAEKEVGKKMPYKLTSANCEHFVNKLRYGVPLCDQVPSGCKATGLFIAGLLGSAALAPALGAPVLATTAVYGICTFLTDLAWQQWKKR